MLNIVNKFSVAKLLNTLKCLHDEFGSQSLPDTSLMHQFIHKTITALNEFSGTELKEAVENDDEHEKIAEVILPDDHFALHALDKLSFNDAQWLEADDECIFVHSYFTRQAALALGIKPYHSKFLDQYLSDNQQFGTEFGQREEITQRIQNILREYPLDVTLLKELLQNADDARATKMCVVLDKRKHEGERLPSEEWKELQGPSLLVWNNRDFSDNDLQGIQKLGLGSKRGNLESIGEFGIGFNIVYHITDCPSFITRSNILCVFDPHCKYVPGATKLSPGRRYDEIDKGDFWEKMSGLHSGFLRGDPLHKQPDYFSSTEGSLFRFPLRCTDALVKNSNIVKAYEKPITALLMERKLKEWVGKIEDAF